MKCYVLTLRDEKSKKRFNRLRDSLLQFGWRSADIIPHYGHNAVDFNNLCEIYSVSTIDFYKNQPENKLTLDKAFSCTAGHVDIWKKIAFAHMGCAIVCEDDVVFKADPEPLLRIASWNKINWLGPRVWHLDDYTPPHNDFRFLEVERFEGTHAYLISEGMAQQLYYKFKKNGFNDSIDGQLGMRNIFAVDHQVCDPPVAVAVVGDQQSSISSETAFWNADNTEGFLDGLKPSAQIPPERKIHRLDASWEVERASVLAEIDSCSSAIFVGAGDGNHVREIVDAAACRCIIYDSEFHPVVHNNLYLSKYYYEIAMIQAAAQSALVDAVGKPPLDLIVLNNPADAESAIKSMALAWLALAPGGKLIVRGIDKSFNNVLSGVNAKCLLNLPTTQVYQKQSIGQ